MKSLFNPTVNKEMIDRILKLNAENKPFWGKMSAAQMIAHSQAPFKVAFEELKLKRGMIGILFGGIAKKRMLGPDPFGKNLPTDKSFKINGQPDFDKEKNKLIEYVLRFAKAGHDGITKEAHPFFGKMKPEEWDTLMYKHLDHHLRQFGG